MEKIIKRDGSIVDYDVNKIATAIWKAAKSVGGKDYHMSVDLSQKVEQDLDNLYPDGIASVEQIQDRVERTLINEGHYTTGKAYILYRKQREEARNIANAKKLNNKIITKYIGGDDWRNKENSNMTYSLQGMNFLISGQMVESFWFDEVYPAAIGQAHYSGDFHVHDTSVLGPYCVGWDLESLLMLGFRGVQGKIASKPPKHFRTALGQIVNYLYTLQGESAGAQAFSNFDTLLAPFIRYDNLTYSQIKQALQEFTFNMNVPTRVGFQTPFTNVTMDMVCPSHFKDKPVIIGGEYMDTTYGEFQEEINIFNQVFAEIMTEGDADGRVFTFPIPTYNITDNFNWDDPRFNKVWEMTARYGIPYFSNFVGSDMNPEDARSMCCRLRLDNRELQKRGGGLFGANPLTGSIGVVTVNMARLGHYATDQEDYFLRLGLLMDMAMESLEVKRKVLENFTEQGLYPYTRFYLKGVKEATGQYWTNHFSTIGLVGMNESCMNLLGKDIMSPEGHEFSIQTLEFMRKRLTCYQEKTGNLYNLEATPAEGCSYSLLLKDKKLFDVPYPYYSNSTQLPVQATDDLFKALKHQEGLQSLYTGGTVFHTFLGESPEPESVKKLLKKMVEFKIPYYSVTPSFSVCMEHGYLKGEVWECPHCGSATEVYSRVVGYLRPIQQYNKGKAQEAKDRKKFDQAFV